MKTLIFPMFKRHLNKRVIFVFLLYWFLTTAFLISQLPHNDLNHNILERTRLPQTNNKSKFPSFPDLNSNDLQNSDYWKPEPISIDGNTSWATKASTEPWCSGSGNSTHPYIIEYVSIDGRGSDDYISILNSDVYFIIRNCRLFNSTSIDAGINLYKVQNGLLTHNSCFNNHKGIYLELSSNNIISDNSATNIEWCGIELLDCHDNIIKNNVITHNEGRGIVLEGSNDNTIKGNELEDNNNGIDLEKSHDNNIEENELIDNQYGINIHSSKHNILKENTLEDNLGGVYLSKSIKCTITENEITGSTGDGIYLEQSEKNLIVKNLVKNNKENGISLGGSNYNQIKLNVIKYNKEYGLYLYSGKENKISDNKFIGNGMFSMFLIPWDRDSLGNIIEYNYFEPEFHFILGVSICVITCLSVYSILNLYRKVKLLKRFSQAHPRDLAYLYNSHLLDN